MGVDSGAALPSVTVENSGKSPTLFLENGDFPVKGVCYLKQLEVVGPTPRYTHGEVWPHSCSALYALPEPRPPCACRSEPLSSCSHSPSPGISGMCLLWDWQLEEKEQGRLTLLPVLECTCLLCVFCVLLDLVR